MPRLIQNTLTPLWELRKVKGVDNVAADKLRLEPGFVRVCENIDIDDQFMIERRDGILQKLLNGSAHSGWAEGDLCMMVLDNDLVRIHTNWEHEALVADVGPTKMNYVRAGTMVFFSNLTYVGYVESGTAYGFPDEYRVNRVKMPGGHLLESHAARLYVAQDSFIYRSIPGSPFELDAEKDFIFMGGRITMMNGVNGPAGENGLFVSGGEKCAYLSDLEPSLETASYKVVLDVPALPGSAVAVEEMDLGRGGGMVGRCVIWSTEKGIYMGLPGGMVKDLTSKHFKVEGIVDGYSFIRDHRGYRQYFYVGNPLAGIGEAQLGLTEPASILAMRST